MADAEPAELVGDARALGAGAGLEGRAQPPVGGVDAQAAARLGIDEGQLADVDEGLLARVGDLDGEDGVAGRRRRSAAGASRAAPRKSETMATRPAVVREAATVRSAPATDDAPPPSSGGSSASEPEQAEHAVAATGRRADHGRVPAIAEGDDAEPVGAPGDEARRRPGPRLRPRRPCADRRSRSASRPSGRASSHAVSWRSGTSSRTCGMPLRAVAFQSMRRTSSPGSYGRMRSRSRPAPRPRPRWSPTIRAPERRVRAISRRRTRSSAIGPGPGRAAVRSRPASRARSPAARRVGGHAVAAGWAARSSCGAGTRPRTRG